MDRFLSRIEVQSPSILIGKKTILVQTPLLALNAFGGRSIMIMIKLQLMMFGAILAFGMCGVI